MLDLQKLSIRRVLDSQNSDLYSKLSPKYFSGTNLLLYGKIEHFYRNNLRIPTIDEFSVLKKDISLQDYFDSQIMDEENINNNIENEFLVSQLQDFYVREEAISFIDYFLDNLNDFESTEVLDQFQNILLELNNSIPINDELIDVTLLETVPSADTFVMYPSGLSEEYDRINGGFALQELVCIGGRRGSGKSILALNATLNRFLGTTFMPEKIIPSTTAFFSIEMRHIEVYYRLMSIISRVPFLCFMKNILTKEQTYQAAKAKTKTFYKPSKLIEEELIKLNKNGDIKAFDEKIKNEKPPLKDNRFFIIDDPSLTLNRIDHYCNLFINKYPNFTLSTVDYLNIIKIDESKDWKTQIIVAENLKNFSRKYNITVISPYQVDATLEARYAKGILDSADRAFTFSPSDPDNKEEKDKLTLYTAKVRNGKNITFDVGMDWECTRVDQTGGINSLNKEKLLPGAQYGSKGGEENERDV